MFEARQWPGNQWRWTFKDETGKAICDSNFYPSREDCLYSLEKLLRATSGGNIEVMCYGYEEERRDVSI